MSIDVIEIEEEPKVSFGKVVDMDEEPKPDFGNVVDMEEAPKPKVVRKVKRKLTRQDRTKRIKELDSKLKLAMVKPDIVADREKERKLSYIATKGVTQLFNTVSQRQQEKRDQTKIEMIKKKETKPASVALPPLAPSVASRMKIRVPFAPSNLNPEVEVKEEEPSDDD